MLRKHDTISNVNHMGTIFQQISNVIFNTYSDFFWLHSYYLFISINYMIDTNGH